MERGTAKQTSEGGVTEGKTKPGSTHAAAKPAKDSKDDSQPSLLDRIGYSGLGFIFGILAAALFLGFRLIDDGPKILSWPIAIFIGILTPGAFGIAASYSTPWLHRFFHSRFWWRFLRLALCVFGVLILLIGVVLLVIGVIKISFGAILGALAFLALGLMALWTVFRGTDEDVSDFFDY